MKALIFGLGRMGEATAYAMTQLGYDVYGVDVDKEKCSEMLNKRWCGWADWNVEGAKERNLQEKPDIVISCLPYTANYEIAHWCIYNSLRYCDLGGNVLVSDRINALASKHAKAPVFTDLGLAPGLVNIVAEKLFNDFPVVPTDVHLYVGGIGVHARGTVMCHGCNWSPEGLVNEYLDMSEVLENGKVTKIEPLSVYDSLKVYYESDEGYTDYLSYEFFNTSGGLAHTLGLMERRGVQNCAYYTLRETGHYRMLHFFLKNLNYNREQLKDVLEKTCVDKYWDNDKVVMAVRIGRGNLVSFWDHYEYREESQFSMMQKYTAFTLAAVASIMATSVFDDKTTLDYSDVGRYYEVFDGLLKKLGVELDVE